jgi:hypothetical protein
MIYCHRVLDFTEMCSEVHFTYYVAFDLFSRLLLLRRSLSASCVAMSCSIYGGCLVVYLHSHSFGNYSGVSTLFVSIVVWFFINSWYIVNYP